MTALDRLAPQLESALDRARRDRRQYASITVDCPAFEPAALFAAAANERRTLWHQPALDFAFVAIGVCEEYGATGLDRFDALRRHRDCALSGLEASGDAPIALPLTVASLAFSPSVDEDVVREVPDATLVLPEMLFIRHKGHHWLNLTLRADTDTRVCEVVERAGTLLGAQYRACPADALALSLTEEVDCATWSSQVESILRDIAAGRVDKVVLARTLRAEAPRAFDLGRALSALADRYPACTVFATTLEDDRCFLGATPEKLLRFTDGEAQIDCIAGSIRIGTDVLESEELVSRLLEDRKERHEHAFVARAIVEAIEPLTDAIDMPDTPSIIRTADVQHLHTPVRACVRDGVDILALAEALHPTPAVGGYPRRVALERIDALETFDRSLYAGPQGWIDAQGNGEFVVALRSALVEGNMARLYAGAGIVAGSQPAREFEETGLKMKAMLWALQQA